MLVWGMALFSYGLDPAMAAGVANDYTGIVVHRIEAVDPLPKLQTLRKVTGTYPVIDQILMHELFPKYPPAIIVTDYTNEKTFSQLLEAKGYQVLKVNFTDANKLLLKQEGLKMKQSGYAFPDPQGITNLQVRGWVEELIQQLQQEQLISSPSGKPSFIHPQGQHNDLAHGWELSIHGCYILMQTSESGEPIVVSRGWHTPSSDDYNADLKKAGFQITGEQVHTP